MGSIIEAVSWRMVTEVCRCSPELLIRETHPGGGQYDCLSLYHPHHGHLADLNRTGSVHVFQRLDGADPPESWQAWNECLESDTAALVDGLSKRLGQTTPARLPSSTPRVIVYRVIAAVVGAAAFNRQRWECWSGLLDGSDDVGGVPRGSTHFLVQRLPYSTRHSESSTRQPDVIGFCSVTESRSSASTRTAPPPSRRGHDLTVGWLLAVSAVSGFVPV